MPPDANGKVATTYPHTNPAESKLKKISCKISTQCNNRILSSIETSDDNKHFNEKCVICLIIIYNICITY